MTTARSSLPHTATRVLLTFPAREPVTTAELRAQLAPMNSNSMRSALSLLVATRLVRRLHSGVYQLTDEGLTASAHRP